MGSFQHLVETARQRVGIAVSQHEPVSQGLRRGQENPWQAREEILVRHASHDRGRSWTMSIGNAETIDMDLNNVWQADGLVVPCRPVPEVDRVCPGLIANNFKLP